MSGIVHWIDTAGTPRTEASDVIPLRDRLQQFVGGEIELVWVLWKGHRTAMIVNDTGAITTDARGRLPINVIASEIYAEASRRQSDLPQGFVPLIFGNAVLLENIQVD
ncbi:hypothetical protein B0G84_5696 [Paraburkholderia sp. BL8N3]|nr:hypothetical protein [Paraburkholderia sp. BL8N3]TCK36683.1 hypothetical protein B0G84_5696 [Paraburkholderia sp. BL8N3]